MTDDFGAVLPDGTEIGDGVVLGRAIGAGAWGVVYEGHHPTLGRVAIKEYRPDGPNVLGSADQSGVKSLRQALADGLAAFRKEGQILRRISHKNIVGIHDVIDVEQTAFLVMEYVEGVTLNEALRAGRFREPNEIVALSLAVVDAVAAIHAEHVLHRDIAPDNIMVRPDGSPVIIDFGGARAAAVTKARMTRVIARDGYSPPEQYDQDHPGDFAVGPWSDLYACGAVLYRLVTRAEPASAQKRLLALLHRRDAPMTPLSKLNPQGYPATWLAAVDHALNLKPADRPQSASAWRAELQRKDVAAPPWRSAAVLAVLVAAVAGGFFLWSKRPGPASFEALEAPPLALQAGNVTDDCNGAADCAYPRMVVIQAGTVAMRLPPPPPAPVPPVEDISASPIGDLFEEVAPPQPAPTEAVSTPIADAAVTPPPPDAPPRTVNIQSFLVSETPITRKQFKAYLKAKGWTSPVCEGGNTFEAPGYDQPNDDEQPAVCIGWNDAQQYVIWLSETTGKTYRLLSEAEYEFAARGGGPNADSAAFWWGEWADHCKAVNGRDISYDMALGQPSPAGECNDHTAYTSDVRHFQPNSFKLYAMIGNTWSWVEDCFSASYDALPENGTAFMEDNCASHVVRGGSFADGEAFLRSNGRQAGKGDNATGFRVARDL